MSTVSVRSADPDDAPAVESLARAAWHAAYDDFLGESTVESVLADWYDVESLREATADDDHVFPVAVEDGDVVGFAHAARSPEEEGWMLFRLYVHPDRWGEGIGTALLDRLEDELQARDVGTYELAVLAENEVGVSFYESRGFERVGTERTELAGVETSEHWYRKDLGDGHG